MSHEVIAPNIRRIRSSKYLSQAEVAKETGISLSAYRKIENGQSIPRVDTLQAIASALDVKIQNLVAPILTLSDVRFRALKKMTARQQILVDVATWLENYNRLEELLNNKVEFKFEALAKELVKNKILRNNPQQVAQKARDVLDIKDNEIIRDICGLLEASGIKVYSYSFTNDSFFGLSVGLGDGGPAIIVNTNRRMPVERWIFSAAHELGHLLLHLDSFDSEKGVEEKEQESQANQFASYFLMPNDVFKREWKETFGHPLVIRVLKVKRIFKVSYKTVLMRLIDNGSAEKNIWAQYNWQFKKITGRSLNGKEEPLGIAPGEFAEVKSADEAANLLQEDFLPDRLYYLVRKAVNAEKISLSRAAEILRINLKEMRELLKFWVLDE